MKNYEITLEFKAFRTVNISAQSMGKAIDEAIELFSSDSTADCMEKIEFKQVCYAEIANRKTNS